MPLFPFGHGLSYTTFKYSDLEISPVDADCHFTVSLEVENTGKVQGSEVVQVYISDPESSLPRPVKELKGFTKVALEAGEKKTVSVSLDREAVGFYDDRRGSWVAEKGKFEMVVAASSVDVRLTGELSLERSCTWTGL